MEEKKALNKTTQEMAAALETIFESEDKGIVLIKEDGKVAAYSKTAKLMTGVYLHTNKKHPGGVIKDGDIVIISDNELSNDDDIVPEDLACINIHDENIEKGDALVAVGVYNNSDVQPVYKYEKNWNPNGKLGLDTEFLGFHIKSIIDYADHKLQICVNDEEYEMEYFEAVGFMVIVDGITGNVKFFQARGCGIRDEEMGKILKGHPWLPKIGREESGSFIPEEKFTVNGVFGEKEIENVIWHLMDSPNGTSEKGIYIIYKKPAYCQMIRVRNGSEADGVYVLVQDVTNIDRIREEKRDIIDLLEKKQKKFIEIKSSEDSGRYTEIEKMVGQSNSMREIKGLAHKASKSKFNVLITGESGTGKSMLAREIHDLWKSDAPFVEVNCNAIAPSLFESELFGYEAGAFTGAATKGKVGFFEEANGGTLFLDEIGDIPLEIQVKLLQALQNKKIYRVGSSKPINIDVRVITATNRDLKKAVEEGSFRKDLFYRINVFPINIPPLRERLDDLYLLINSLLTQISAEYGAGQKLLSEDAMTKMIKYSWPGNVRELQNVLERAVVLTESPVIYSEMIMIEDEETAPITLKERLSKAEQEIITDSYRRNRGDKKKMMEELDLSQSSLYEKLKKYKAE